MIIYVSDGKRVQPYNIQSNSCLSDMKEQIVVYEQGNGDNDVDWLLFKLRWHSFLQRL